MGIRLRKIVLSVLFVSLIPLSVIAPVSAGTALAEGPCPTGTNWDTGTQSCR